MACRTTEATIRPVPVSIVAALTIAVAGVLAARADPSPSPVPVPAATPAPIVTVERHPDTADSRGPYRVAFRQIAGPEPIRGRLLYTVGDAGGTVRSRGEADLRRVDPGGRSAVVWSGEIPGQGTGSILHYHARFEMNGGREWRHPGREPAEFRFRVLPIRVLSVDLPGPEAVASGRSRIRLRVEAAAPPTGEVVLRILPAPSGAPADHRLPLAVREERRGDQGSQATALYDLQARLPALRPGGIADFHFRLRSAAGAEVTVPPDAAARSWRVRRPPADVRPMEDGRAFVLGLAADGDRRWIGLQGMGLWIEDPEGGRRRLGVEAGIASTVARFILPDPVAGRTFVGTNAGVRAVFGAGDAWLPVGSPSPAAGSGGVREASGIAWRDRAGPGLLSPIDGSFLAQVQTEGGPGSPAGEAAVVELIDDVAIRTVLPIPDLPLIGLSAAAFDAVDGCRLLGGYVRHGASGRLPAVLRSCGGAAQTIALRDLAIDGRSATPLRIIALARDPWNGALVAAVETTPADGDASVGGAGANDEARVANYGLFSVDMTSGRLAPVAPGAERIGAEISAIVTDRARGVLIAGTVGRGLIAIGQGGLTVVPLPGMTSEITALHLDDATGTLLIGTTAGAFAMPAAGGPVEPIGPRGGGPSLIGFLPEDVDPAGSRLLLASATGGSIAARRSRAGGFVVEEHLRPGHELPEALIGDARFLPGGGLGVIVRSRGLFLRDGGGQVLIGAAEGLQGDHPMRLLARRDGELWLAHLPLPFGTGSGAAVQILRDRKVTTTIPVAGRETASIADWVEIAGRGAVFAATPAGVIEFRPEGTTARLSRSAASAIAHDPGTGMIVAAGAGIERWNGSEFVPIRFAPPDPRRPGEAIGAGRLLDIAIGRKSLLYVLHAGGMVAQIDVNGNLLGLLDTGDGIPWSATRLLALPRTGEIVVGATHEVPAIVSGSR